LILIFGFGGLRAKGPGEEPAVW